MKVFKFIGPGKVQIVSVSDVSMISGDWIIWDEEAQKAFSGMKYFHLENDVIIGIFRGFEDPNLGENVGFWGYMVALSSESFSWAWEKISLGLASLWEKLKEATLKGVEWVKENFAKFVAWLKKSFGVEETPVSSGNWVNDFYKYDATTVVA